MWPSASTAPSYCSFSVWCIAVFGIAASSGVVVQLQARAAPLGGVEVAPARRRDVGGAEIVAAEADVGHEDVVLRHHHLLEHLALGADDADRAGDERGHAHVALAVDGHRVEQLVAGEVEEQEPAARREGGSL